MEYLGTDKLVNKIQPLVTVCAMAYRHAPYIKQCLESVLNQKTDFPFEIIIGEDDSTDGTREICCEYAQLHPDKIRLFLRSRKDVFIMNGRPTGKNNFIKGIRTARGKYTALIDGDDYWTDPYKLQKQFDFMEQHPQFSTVAHNAIMIDEGGQVLKEKMFSYDKSDFVYQDFVARNLRFPTASVFYRTEIDIIPAWFYEIFGGDRALLFTLSKSGAIKYLDFIGCAYRQISTSVESSFRDSNNKLALRNIEEDLVYMRVVEPKHQYLVSKRLRWNYFYLLATSVKGFKIRDTLKLIYPFLKYSFKSLSFV